MMYFSLQMGSIIIMQSGTNFEFDFSFDFLCLPKPVQKHSILTNCSHLNADFDSPKMYSAQHTLRTLNGIFEMLTAQAVEFIEKKNNSYDNIENWNHSVVQESDVKTVWNRKTNFNAFLAVWIWILSKELNRKFYIGINHKKELINFLFLFSGSEYGGIADYR